MHTYVCEIVIILCIYLYLKPLLARTRIIKHTAAEQKVAVRVKIYRCVWYYKCVQRRATHTHKNEKLVAVRDGACIKE